MLRCASECKGDERGGSSTTLPTVEGALCRSDHRWVWYHVLFIAIDHRFRIVSLTRTFSCIQSASDGRDRTFLYSAFTAASVLQAHILQDATRLLNNLPAVIPAPARHFPAVSTLRKYPGSSDGYFKFEIRSFFPDRQPYRLLYVAETPGVDKRLVLIKFARRYSIELHEICANLGHARFWATSWRMVCCGNGIYWVYRPNHSLRPACCSQRLLDGWAPGPHGVLSWKGFGSRWLTGCEYNNIICKNDSVMLIDFDWGGKEGHVSYPTPNLNPELLQGRVSGDLRIMKEDDRRVLKNTLARLMAIDG